LLLLRPRTSTDTCTGTGTDFRIADDLLSNTAEAATFAVASAFLTSTSIVTSIRATEVKPWFGLLDTELLRALDHAVSTTTECMFISVLSHELGLPKNPSPRIGARADHSSHQRRTSPLQLLLVRVLVPANIGRWWSLDATVPLTVHFSMGGVGLANPQTYLDAMTVIDHPPIFM